MDVLLDTQTAAEACLGQTADAENTREVIKHVRACGGRAWLYAGYAAKLTSDLRSICLGRQQSPTVARETATQALNHCRTEGWQWLAALSSDADAIAQSDCEPAHAQILAAVRRLGSEASLLTRNADLIAASEQALSPEDWLEQYPETPTSKIPFIDLQRQQDRIRPALETGLHRVLHHGQYILGPEVHELEQRLASYVGVKHCITVGSGTDSLLVALMALEIGPGDEVITVPYTWISTAEMIALIGATPVFVDIDPHIWNLDPTKLEAAITERTKAIMPVGIYGQPADMDAINAIAARHGDIPVIEDAAQCFGATHHGKRSCALSTIGSTSFFPSKPLGGYGEGGALFTSDDHLAERMRWIRVHGQEKKHHHPILGINGRLDTLQAATLLAKHDVFDEEIRNRQEVARRYHANLPTGLCTPPTTAEGNTSVYAQYTILSPRRDEIHQALQAEGIPSVSYYAVPLHRQPVFASLGYNEGDFPITEQVAAEGLSLPMNPDLRENDQNRILTVLRNLA